MTKTTTKSEQVLARYEEWVSLFIKVNFIQGIIIHRYNAGKAYWRIHGRWGVDDEDCD